jgi:hypothetical protein
MLLFDYIFYRVSRFYKKWEDDTFYFYGIGLVSLLQLSYFVLILLLFAFLSSDINYLLFEKGKGENFLTSGVVFPALLFFALNLVRYLKVKPYEILDSKWGEEHESRQKRRKYELIFLFIISIGLTVSLSVFRRYYL